MQSLNVSKIYTSDCPENRGLLPMVMALILVLCAVSGITLIIWPRVALAENVILPQTLSTIQTELDKLNGKDLQEISAAATKLGNYPYIEVEVALLRVMDDQIKRFNSGSKANSYIFSAAAASLAKIASQVSKEDIIKIDRYLGSNTLGFNEIATNNVKVALNAAIARTALNPSNRSLYPLKQKNLKEGNNYKTIAEILHDAVEANKITEKEKASLLSVIEGLEESIYDSIIDNLKLGESTHFGGRDNELEQMKQAALRMDKSHILVTGKAGVGKTTVIRMLQKGWIDGTIFHPGNQPPLILELPITDITNQNDPTILKERIKAAQSIAQKLDRHVFLFIDEAHVSTKISRNSIKSFLSKSLKDSRVHFIWATTSSESREFLSDSAFMRRWTEIFIPEFTNEQAINTIRVAYFKKWQNEHARVGISLREISDEAFQLAVKYANFEQPHAGNPTGLKEILEGTIIYRLSELEKKVKEGVSLSADERNFVIQPSDLRNYLTFRLGMKLVPGDPKFEEKFSDLWKKFEDNYVGNEGFKNSELERLKNFFGSFHRTKMDAELMFGPPGAGKSYVPEKVAEIFFDTKPLILSCAEYSEGGLGLNKMIGSPTGTVGSEEQRSVLTKYIKDHPRGGVIVLEEADLAHQDVFNFLVNWFSSKKFTDGLGQEWNTEHFLIYLTTNVGQDLVIANDGKGTKVTWEELETRVKNITSDVSREGKIVREVKPAILNQLFDTFISKVSADSSPQKDTSVAQQEGVKLKRRIKGAYILPPTLDNLKEAALRTVINRKNDYVKEYGLTLNISEEDVLRLLDLKSFTFEQGYSFVESQLDARLFTHITSFLGSKKQVNLNVSLGHEVITYGRKKVQGLVLNLSDENRTESYSLGTNIPNANNPWFNNEQIMKRIQDFPITMSAKIMNKQAQISKLHDMIRAKALNWKNHIVWTDLGTSGNGKTELGFTVAESIFGTRNAAFKISGISNWGDLNNYLRSDVGFMGSNQETDFEKWFKSRMFSGGGVIIFDELLSLSGLDQGAISAKISAINKLYDMLDEGVIRFGNKSYDASAFMIQLTGNALQEVFSRIDDSPESEKLVKRLLGKISDADIINYFNKLGIDAPKVARFGPIFINGPLDQKTTLEVSAKEIKNALTEATNELSEIYDIDVKIDPRIVEEVTKRVTTVKLGMRKVKQALQTIIVEPVMSIFSERVGTEQVSADFVNGKIIWKADGHQVEKISRSIDGTSAISTHWLPAEESSKGNVITPQLINLTQEPKVKVTDEQAYRINLHELYGHWMTDFILTGKNHADFISLIPGDGYLGFVLPKDNSLEYNGKRLTEWLREAAILQAGSRAVFISGFWDSGGGHDGKRGNENPQDDLGRVEQIFESMLSNQIFKSLSEFKKGPKQELFKEFMRHVSKGMADRVIRFGKNSNLFSPMFDEVLSKRFISGERIEEVLEKIELSRLPNADHMLLWTLSTSVVQALKRMQKEPGINSASLQILADFAYELVNKSTIETTKIIRLKGKNIDRWIEENQMKTNSNIRKIFDSTTKISKSVARPSRSRIGNSKKTQCMVFYKRGAL